MVAPIKSIFRDPAPVPYTLPKVSLAPSECIDNIKHRGFVIANKKADMDVHNALITKFIRHKSNRGENIYFYKKNKVLIFNDHPAPTHLAAQLFYEYKNDKPLYIRYWAQYKDQIIYSNEVEVEIIWKKK